ncbi:MAG: response regulator [Candidatus Adiutrix sp.]|jgi:signal transduction histidine kinase/ActR/RegA family two-component response regulator/HPt (histidine-containing phosphotransfer) domain-containing protein|nr:response regulator [Candidatus Adiutrix sp.]
MKFKAALKNEYRQLLFVCAAFLTMALASYYYAGELMKKQIDLLSQSEMQVYKVQMRSLILAHEAALQHASASVVMIMEKGGGPDELQDVLSSLTRVFREQKDLTDVFVSVYGYLDGNYLDGTSWIPGEFYNPKIAPWMRGAIVQNGIFHSKPYIDPRTGNAVSSVSMVVFDNSGESHGVLAVDYFLTPLAERVRDYKVADTGYGLLLDDSFNVLTFPDSAWIGRNIGEVPGFSGLRSGLEKIGDQVLIEAIDSGGVTNIGFFSRLENGWYLGIVAPVQHYYSEVSGMLPFIFVLSFVLILILCYILISLSAAKAKVEEESRSKSSFLARMSHEIRTPLNAIIGMSELARRQYGQPRALGHINEISRAGANMLALINDILDLSKVESGNMQLNPAPYRTAALLGDVLAIIKVRLNDRPVSLVIETDPQTPSVLVGDEARVRQILMNLLSNAVKYTVEGQIVFRVESEADREGNGRIKLVFVVKDTGPGIRTEHLELLFDDFVRLDQGAAGHIEGTGLGLPIARSLCRAMGGDISVTSEYGRGSAFTATIRQLVDDWRPMNLADEERCGQSPADASEIFFTAPEFRVLLVDDTATNLVVAKGLLEPYQMRISTCLSGQEALEAIRAHCFDLIFLDHMMPGLDGLETLKAVRGLGGRHKTVPVVAMTANALAGMKEMFLAKGFDDYLSKPIELDKLHGLLDKWVPPSARGRPASSESAPSSAGPLSLGVNGLDSGLGLKNIGGSVRNYLEALSIFCRDVESNLPGLKNRPGEDTASLVTRLHALKSAAANIGAVDLSAEAAGLEAAVRREGAAGLRSDLAGFHYRLADFSARLQKAIAGTEAPPSPDSPAGKGKLSAAALRLLREAVEAGNIGLMDHLLEESMAGDNSEEVRAQLSKMEEHFLLADFQEAVLLIDSLIAETEAQ